MFEKFYWMIAKITAERFVNKEKSAIMAQALIKTKESGEMPAHSESTSISVEIFFSDGCSQWFITEQSNTVKSLQDDVAKDIQRGQTLCDLAYARLYESCINPVSGERQFNTLEDTWTVSTVLARAKYASCHRLYFLGKVCY